MQEKAAHEFISGERDGSLLLATGVIFGTKGNLAIFKCQQAVIGDGHAVRVATEIGQHLLRARKGRLGIDVPLAGTDSSK
jgi:hypothetical protein